MSSIFKILFGKKDASASVAKERLQIVLAHERSSRNAPDFLPALQKEIMAVVAKYLEVDDDAIRVRLDKDGGTSVLEINVDIDQSKLKKATPRIETKKIEAKG